MTRTVKLTTQEPTDETLTALCQEAVLPDDDGIIAWEKAHDAAPDDATKALEEFARAMEDLRRDHPEDVEPALEALWARFTETRAGIVFIRQAEERNDAGE
jgi:predicted negative regulator of RcsB-dependent stress response